MGVNMTKGGNISLTKVAEQSGVSLDDVIVACGWDAKKGGLFAGKGYDLDLSAACLDTSGKVPDETDPIDPGWQNWHIWANHRFPANRCLDFKGDNRTGAGDGDDEMIEVKLADVPAKIERIVFGVVIWQARERGGQTFGEVKNSFIRVFDKRTRQEFARYDLGAEFADETFVMFGELYRRAAEWKFRALGQGYDAASFRREFNIHRSFETDYARYAN